MGLWFLTVRRVPVLLVFLGVTGPSLDRQGGVFYLLPAAVTDLKPVLSF